MITMGNGTTSAADFCYATGMRMTMNMDGFHFFAQGQHCLAFFFRNWLLSDQAKFYGAVVYAFLLAFLVEASSALRVHLERHFYRKLSHTFVYALQALLGYLIMLICMSYNIQILLSVVAGLMVGNLVFMQHYHNADLFATPDPDTTRRRRQVYEEQQQIGALLLQHRP
jgi:hypothetical protein